MAKPRWYHVACLLALILIGCGLRLKNLTKNAVWRDEYWALYLATGRGDTLFQIPSQTLVKNPPDVGLVGAPHWWHIWNGLHSVVHPPFYYFLLRWWVDLFGQSDRSIRMLSVLFGLLAIALIFDSVRLCAGASSGVVAAAIVAFAPPQIDFSQQARPYTLMACFALAICNVLLRIEKHGKSPVKLAWLALFIALAAMTHYFDLGIILAAGIYALLFFKGPVRRRSIAVIVSVVLIFAAVWVPNFLRSAAAMHTGLGFTDPNASLPLSILDAPQRLIFGVVRNGKWFVAAAMAILVYLLPPFDRQKRIWWLAAVLPLLTVVALDLARHSVLMQIDRYVFAASPGVCAIAAMPVNRWLGRAVPIAVLFGAVAFGLARVQQGPDLTGTVSVLQIEDERFIAGFLARNLAPGDVVVLTNNDINYPAFEYEAIAHYSGPWKVPIVLLFDPADAVLKRQLSTCPRVWMVGNQMVQDTRWYFPNWRAIGRGGNTAFFSVWEIQPPTTPAP
ncbi:MAG: glycosyltransferase family 39 protein [Tepidisphaeraceae bacterium]|jgi:hypothetical protein